MGNLPSLSIIDLFFHLFIHVAFLMSFYYVPGILGTRVRRVNKIDKILASWELTFQGGEIDNKQINEKDNFDKW